MTSVGLAVQITWLPLLADSPGPAPLSASLRETATRFLGGLDPAGDVVIAVSVGRGVGGRADLGLGLSGSGAPAAARGLRLAVDGLIGMVDGPVDVVVPRGGAAWRLRPVGPTRLPGTSEHVTWPLDGFDWPEVLACVERLPGVEALYVHLRPVRVPAGLPVLARRARRQRREQPDAPTEDRYDAFDELRSGAFAAEVSVLADRDSAGRLAACLLTAEGRRGIRVDVVPAGTATSPDGLAGLLPVGHAAALLPLVGLGERDRTRFPRRVPPPASWAPSTPVGPGVEVGVTSAGTYQLPVADLAQHLIVTGLPGFGKSTTMMTLLVRLWREHGVPFLVIDPEKDEYAGPVSALGGEPMVLRLGRDGLRINPMAVPEGVDPLAFGGTVAEFLDAATRLGESWPLAASVLRTVVSGLYASAEVEPPTVARLYRDVRKWAATHAGHRSASDVELSLCSRILGLLSGPNATALAGGPGAGLDWGRLLSRPSLISLAGYGDLGSRQLAFGLILAGLVEYRRAHPAPGLAHLAVLEEAHLVLGAGRDGQPVPGEQAVATALATLRGQGQGIALVTQTPGQLSRVVNDLFPNRLSHRLSAAAASEAGFGQRESGDRAATTLSLLERGEALVVSAGSQPLPVLVRIVADPLVNARGQLPQSVPATGPVEPIWCVDCPTPCRGRSTLAFLPAVHAALDGSARDTGLRSLAATAVETAAGLAGARRMLRESNVRASLYCVAARALTERLAGEPARLTLATGMVAAVVDRFVEAHRRRQSAVIERGGTS